MKILPVSNYQAQNQNNRKQNLNFEAFRVENGEAFGIISNLCRQYGIKFDYNNKINLYVLEEEPKIAWERYLTSHDEGMKYTAGIVENAKEITCKIASGIWEEIVGKSNEEAASIVKGHLTSDAIADLHDV